jgi:hypothetical protein
VYFRGTFDLPYRPTHAPLVVAHPRQFVLHVNGVQVASGGGPARPRVVDVASHLRPGSNVLALAVTGPVADATATDTRAGQTVPHALFVQVQARRDAQAPLEVVFGSGADWRWSARGPKGWEQPLFPDRSWTRVTEVPADLARPAPVGTALEAALAATTLYGRTRAALRPATPLTTALGRPGREQVVTVRADAPTTLQALELANGETLSALVKAGAARLREERGATATAITTRVFQRALGRAPTADEQRLAIGMLDAAPDAVPDAAQVEDLLWAVTMLPEFRLVQ